MSDTRLLKSWQGRFDNDWMRKPKRKERAQISIRECVEAVNPCGASDAKVEWVRVGEGSETADAGARIHVEEPCHGGAPKDLQPSAAPRTLAAEIVS